LVNVSLPLVEDLKANVFGGCTALESLEMPNLKYIRQDAFKNLTALKSVSFPDAVLGSEYNAGMSAFQGCKALTSAYIPKLLSIPSYFFQGTSLGSTEFELATTVNNYAFAETMAEMYRFPSLTAIKGDQTFRGCANLKALVLSNAGSVATLESARCFDSYATKTSPIAEGTGYIYVPRALVDSYKVATNWSDMATQFRALEDYTVDGTTTGALDETKI
jgi:hypothetical protein